MNSFTQQIKEGRGQEGRKINIYDAFVANTVVTFYSYLETEMALRRIVDDSKILLTSIAEDVNDKMLRLRSQFALHLTYSRRTVESEGQCSYMGEGNAPQYFS
jgi:hypothetical protein